MRELVHFAAPPLPEKSGDFSGTPLSRTSPGPYPIGRLFSFQGALCKRAMLTNPMGPAKKSSHYVWTKGCQKRSSFEKFLLFFRPSVPQAGRIQRGPSLVKPLERPFMGVLGKNLFLRESGTPLPSVAAIVHSSPREEQVMGWHPPKSKSEVSCGFARSQVLCFSS